MERESDAARVPACAGWLWSRIHKGSKAGVVEPRVGPSVIVIRGARTADTFGN